LNVVAVAAASVVRPEAAAAASVEALEVVAVVTSVEVAAVACAAVTAGVEEVRLLPRFWSRYMVQSQPLGVKWFIPLGPVLDSHNPPTTFPYLAHTFHHLSYYQSLDPGPVANFT